MAIQVNAELGDINQFPAGVVALKYAQAPYGADARVFQTLALHNNYSPLTLPEEGNYLLLRSNGAIAANHALFVGVRSLDWFEYSEIRAFSKKVLAILAKELPNTSHVALTIHGVGYGLDEVESLESELAGLFDAIQSKEIPPALRQISIVEINSQRAERIQVVIDRFLKEYGVVGPDGIVTDVPNSKKTGLEDVGVKSAAKPHIFVAMPFSDDMDDIYNYGIVKPANAAGYLCERADIVPFTGDILERIKSRIETASLVIAELSGSNPNVYLEVGYAWGKGRPTVLLVKNTDDLKFDIRGQRCITYNRILDLESSLERELNGL